MNTLWRSLSANYYLDDLSGPLQLQHSIEDRNVPVSFSQGVYEAGKAAGMPVELYEYEGDNHGISVHFRQAMSRTIAFYDKWLRSPLDLPQLHNPTVVAPATVNLRKGPGTDTPVVGRMQPGDQLPIISGSSDGSWWQVQTATGRAWVAASVTLAVRTARVPLAPGS